MNLKKNPALRPRVPGDVTRSVRESLPSAASLPPCYTLQSHARRSRRRDLWRMRHGWRNVAVTRFAALLHPLHGSVHGRLIRGMDRPIDLSGRVAHFATILPPFLHFRGRFCIFVVHPRGLRDRGQRRGLPRGLRRLRARRLGSIARFSPAWISGTCFINTGSEADFSQPGAARQPLVLPGPS